MPGDGGPVLFGVSDLHVGFAANREIVEAIQPRSAHDWLVVAGDVGEFAADIIAALGALRAKFAEVIWAPGNHELWTHRRDPFRLRGRERYEYLVAACRELGVHTPEDPYLTWPGSDEPVVVAPLFTLYDFSFLPDGARTKAEALEQAYASGVVCNDERYLHPDPYPTREAWCAARVSYTEERLEAVPGTSRTILVSHFPLVRSPTTALRFPVFAQWCGTTATADWHLRFRAAAVVYGHLHIPRTTWQDGVRQEEVSLGYPREWRRRGFPAPVPRQILPEVSR